MSNKPKDLKKLKYSCPYFESRGGHCKKTSFTTSWMKSINGCTYPEDIDKCGWNQIRNNN